MYGIVDPSRPINWDAKLNRGLVGWWLCLPNQQRGLYWRDLCGKYHGTLTSMDPATDWVGARGRKGGYGALDFDGSNDLVSVSAISLGTVHTVSFWMDYRDAGDGVVIGDIDGGAGNAFYSPYIDGPSGSIYYRPGANGGAPGFVSVTHGGFTSGTWYHLTIVRNGTTVQFFKNGVQLSTDQTLSANGSQTLSTFGAFSGGTVLTTCRLDDVRFFTLALSINSVRKLYQASLQGYRHELNWMTMWGASEQAAVGGSILRHMMQYAA